jgi:membrane associated rhomboid family serine protease
MANCDACGRHENMPYNCRHCGGTFCSEHRLPENHGCPGLDQWNDPDGVFDSGFDDSVASRGGSGRLLDRIPGTGAGGPLGYFRGNVSYLFLAIIVVVFLLELLVFAVAPQYFESLFILSSAHPEYVWTWVTSVFSHDPGNPWHIFGNGIVLFFFGPVVERQIGSRKFAALFLISGMAAGLGQIAFGFAIGDPVGGVLGASGAIMAILGVLTMTSPDMKVLLYFFIPVPIWLLTLGYAALSVFGALSVGGVMENVAHVAHLVGLMIGLWYGQRVKDRIGRGPQRLQLGGRRGPGGPGGPGRGPR